HAIVMLSADAFAFLLGRRCLQPLAVIVALLARHELRTVDLAVPNGVLRERRGRCEGGSEDGNGNQPGFHFTLLSPALGVSAEISIPWSRAYCLRGRSELTYRK